VQMGPINPQNGNKEKDKKCRKIQGELGSKKAKKKEKKK